MENIIQKLVQQLYNFFDTKNPKNKDIKTRDTNPKSNNEISFDDQTTFHNQFLHVVKTIAGSPIQREWIAFHNCTFILFDVDTKDVKSEGLKIMQQFGEVHVGGSAGDFSSLKLKEDEGYLVTGHYDNMFTYVNPSEKGLQSKEDYHIGLYGRMKRHIDATNLTILAISSELENKTAPIQNNNVIDKIKGVVYGHAIGDAIGLGTEFLNKEQVKIHYPNGFDSYDQIISDKHRSRWNKGEWTDDTDQMLCILESILDKKTVDETDVAKRIHSWAYSGGRGLGNTVYNVISSPKFISQPHETAKQVWIKSGQNAAANGALMRTSILGVWDFNTTEKLKKNTENIAKITHYDPRCIGSCLATTYAISELIKGETDYKKLHKTTTQKAAEYDERLLEYMHLSQNKDIATLQLDQKNSIGYTLKTLAAGFWALQQTDYKTALIQIVNEGGDADTNGAVAGGILGAKFGFSGLPIDWINGLQHKEKLDNLIDRLIQLMKDTKQID